jgi:hypothetical protein
VLDAIEGVLVDVREKGISAAELEQAKTDDALVVPRGHGRRLHAALRPGEPARGLRAVRR